jgi:hypothetical protein
MKYLDLHRVTLFEIITQFRAIFVDETNVTTMTTMASSSSSNTTVFTVESFVGFLESVRVLFLCLVFFLIDFFYWLSLNLPRVTLDYFIGFPNASTKLLQHYAGLFSVFSALGGFAPHFLADRCLAEMTEGPQLSSALEQCMYCAHALARKGLDFRGLLVPLFEQRVVELFKVSSFGSLLPLSNFSFPQSCLSGTLGGLSSSLEEHSWFIPYNLLLKLGIALPSSSSSSTTTSTKSNDHQGVFLF